MPDRSKRHADPLATDADFDLNADLSAEAPKPAAAPAPRVIRDPKPAKGGWWWGTGRRKRATARVRIRPAKEAGGFTICLAGEKTKTLEQYFAEDRDRTDCVLPLKLANMSGKLDVFVRVNGGGFMGQAGAIKMGLSRAISDYDPTVEQALRDAGCLTRDAREVERKKYGQAGARRRYQFSKR